jgi:hypothetical protein
MPVGTHKDAFKAHQLVKRLTLAQPNRELAKMAADILLEFVKSQRQACAGEPPAALPQDAGGYEEDKLDAALKSVDSLCGKCEESHIDSCFVNQARRALIAARTGVDLGLASTDGRLSTNCSPRPVRWPPPSRRRRLPDAGSAFSDRRSGFGEAKLKAELDALKEREVFRATLIDEIVSTIKAVADGDFAAEMPVHDDEQLGKLASAFNLMLKTVKGTLGELDALVDERAKELRLIMGKTPSGILSVDGEGRVNKEHSKSAEMIFGLSELPGRDFLDLLGLTRRRTAERAKLRSSSTSSAWSSFPKRTWRA